MFSNTIEIRHVDESKHEQPKEANANINKVQNITYKHQPELEKDVFRRQAQNANYQFSSEIDDGINGNLHQRIEVRDGLSVKGRYSYSDGYHKRTLFYEADDKGYRVVK